MAVTKLYTIGYEKVGQADFVAALKAAKVRTLVDIREVANSRRAGFAKKSLAAALDSAGITYLHMKSLGTPKPGREAARKGDTPTMTRIFEAKLVEPESQLALAETADLAKRGRTCIMCLEHDWRGCHRAIVARRIEDAFGLMPEHLLPEPR
ncbi:MAG: DUF488 domain-containing protein [Hyphomonadaceae bacterium]|nr:DUF488 domain-containing protein [Hyphomonadaceae bacterium]